jgi:hypothetical protein
MKSLPLPLFVRVEGIAGKACLSGTGSMIPACDLSLPPTGAQ